MGRFKTKILTAGKPLKMAPVAITSGDNIRNVGKRGQAGNGSALHPPQTAWNSVSLQKVQKVVGAPKGGAVH